MQIILASLAHRKSIEALVPRLTEFGVPAWRSREAVERGTLEALKRWFADPPADAAVLAAVDGEELLGFVHVETEPDFFDGTRRGYVSSIALSRAAQGRGAGRALLEAAEAWAAGQGYDYLALTVFAGNLHASGFYERMGYLEDSRKLYKRLRP